MLVLGDGAKALLPAEHQVKPHLSRLPELDQKRFVCGQLFTGPRQKGLEAHSRVSPVLGDGKQASMTARFQDCDFMGRMNKCSLVCSLVMRSL